MAIQQLTVTASELSTLRHALDVLNMIRTRSTDNVGMFSDDNAIDCCNRGIDAIIDLIETSDRIDCNA